MKLVNALRIAILVCLLLVLETTAAAGSSTSHVAFLESYIDGESAMTGTNPPQTVSLTIPDRELIEVRFYAVLETEGATESQIEAWTSITKPVFSGFSENGSVGAQQGSSWIAEAQTRLLLDLSGKINSNGVREGDVIYRISDGAATILIVSAVKGTTTNSNPTLQAIQNLFAGPYSLVFYPSLLVLVSAAFIVKRRFKPIEDRTK